MSQGSAPSVMAEPTAALGDELSNLKIATWGEQVADADAVESSGKFKQWAHEGLPDSAINDDGLVDLDNGNPKGDDSDLGLIGPRNLALEKALYDTSLQPTAGINKDVYDVEPLYVGADLPKDKTDLIIKTVSVAPSSLSSSLLTLCSSTRLPFTRS